jgi:hypothetical protein
LEAEVQLLLARRLVAITTSVPGLFEKLLFDQQKMLFNGKGICCFI